LQSFCFSVRPSGFFVMSAAKGIFHAFAPPQHSTIRTATDWTKAASFRAPSRIR
jgi:hypothetical protein